VRGIIESFREKKVKTELDYIFIRNMFYKNIRMSFNYKTIVGLLFGTV